tara:strand:- start:322 stop:780 length:459 start_codon:yes stop_codon:yes gene_type:complete
MEERKIVIQKLQKSLSDEYAIAQKYYSILSAINNLGLTKREIELVAFTAVKGTISYANARTQFCDKYKTTTATINNIVSKLKKIGIFVKESGKVRVNPIIVLDFKKNLNLVVKIAHYEETERHDAQRVDSEEDVNKDGDIRESDKPGDNTSI